MRKRNLRTSRLFALLAVVIGMTALAFAPVPERKTVSADTGFYLLISETGINSIRVVSDVFVGNLTGLIGIGGKVLREDNGAIVSNLLGIAGMSSNLLSWAPASGVEMSGPDVDSRFTFIVPDRLESMGVYYSLIVGESYKVSVTYMDGFPFGQTVTLAVVDFIYTGTGSYPLPPFPEPAEHYYFVGWYLDEDLTQPYDGRPIYENTALYAKFALKTYTVSFVTNYYGTMSSIKVDALSLLVPLELWREEADFISWYYDKDLTAPYNPAAPVMGHMTLYAKWAAKMVNVRFFVGGELQGEYSFPYGTYLSSVKVYLEDLAGVEYKLFKDAGLTKPLTVSKLTEDFSIYAEIDEPSDETPEPEPAPGGFTEWVKNSPGLSVAAVAVVAFVLFFILRRR